MNSSLHFSLTDGHDTVGWMADQPWCDGSHKSTDMVPVSFEIGEKKTVAMCMCKRTKNKPYCDGSHNDL